MYHFQNNLIHGFKKVVILNKTEENNVQKNHSKIHVYKETKV